MANDTTLTIIGNLTADPELRQAGESPVASFTIASTPRVFDRAANEWKDGEALFLRCSAWRELGQNVAHSLRKGHAVIAQGRLKQRSYEKDGARQTVIELEVESIGPDLRRATAAVTKNQAANQQGAQQYAGAPAQTAYGVPPQGGYPQAYPQGQPYGAPQAPAQAPQYQQYDPNTPF